MMKNKYIQQLKKSNKKLLDEASRILPKPELTLKQESNIKNLLETGTVYIGPLVLETPFLNYNK